MKILFVSPVGALFSGAEVAMANIMTFLSKQGFQVYNVIPDNETNTDSSYISLMDEANISLHSLKTIKWWWPEYYKEESLNKVAITAYQQRNIAEIREIIRNEEIDLVISNTVNVFQGAIAAACEGIPHHYIIHEFPWGEFSYYKGKIDFINAFSDKIFVVSGELHKELEKYFPTDKLIPFIPYSHHERRALLSAEHTRFVSIGGIREDKNQLEIIKAFHALDRTDIELVFIGSWVEEYKSKCDQYINDNNLTNISFLGYKSNPWAFVTDKDIAVLSSKMETFSLVFVESILSGVPAIISDNPGHISAKNYFGSGISYSLGNIKQLTERMLSTLTNFKTEKQKSIEFQAVSRIKYNIEEVSKPFLEVLLDRANSSIASVSGLSDFLGWEPSDELLQLIKGDVVSIFLADTRNEFSITNTLLKPLRKYDKFYIEIKNEKRIRIDLSELPGGYENVSLISQRTQETIPLHHTNGIIEGNRILFLAEDPQLVYDTTKFESDTLIFSYNRLSAEDFYKHYKTLLDSQTELTASFEEKNNVLTEQYAALKAQQDTQLEEYNQLLNQYNSVINSKRWTIATKILNFLRRKK